MGRPKYVYLNQTQIGERTGQDHATVSRKIKLYKLRITKDKLWNFTKYLEMFRAEEERKLGHVVDEDTGECVRDIQMLSGASLKDEKVRRDIQKLDIQILEMRGDLLKVDDVKETHLAIRGIINSVLEQFISYVSAEYSDPMAVENAEQLANKARRMIKKEIYDLAT